MHYSYRELEQIKKKKIGEPLTLALIREAWFRNLLLIGQNSVFVNQRENWSTAMPFRSHTWTVITSLRPNYSGWRADWLHSAID